jgi:hypothetical protein
MDDYIVEHNNEHRWNENIGELNYIPESNDNIYKIKDNTVYIFYTKRFGRMDFSRLNSNECKMACKIILYLATSARPYVRNSKLDTAFIDSQICPFCYQLFEGKEVVELYCTRNISVYSCVECFRTVDCNQYKQYYYDFSLLKPKNLTNIELIKFFDNQLIFYYSIHKYVDDFDYASIINIPWYQEVGNQDGPCKLCHKNEKYLYPTCRDCMDHCNIKTPQNNLFGDMFPLLCQSCRKVKKFKLSICKDCHDMCLVDFYSKIFTKYLCLKNNNDVINILPNDCIMLICNKLISVELKTVDKEKDDEKLFNNNITFSSISLPKNPKVDPNVDDDTYLEIYNNIINEEDNYGDDNNDELTLNPSDDDDDYEINYDDFEDLSS